MEVLVLVGVAVKEAVGVIETVGGTGVGVKLDVGVAEGGTGVLVEVKVAVFVDVAVEV